MPPRPITKEEVDRVATKKEMITQGNGWTLCEVLRSIYITAEKANEGGIMELCRTAFTMAKRMDASMKERAYAATTKEIDKDPKDQTNQYGRSV
jgi:hypothetical protein